MKKSTKQNILTAIIVIAVIGLIGIMIYVIYEEMINQTNNKETSNTILTENKNTTENNTKKQEEKEEDIKKEEEQPKEEEYIGKEEEETSKEENTQISKDDKAIQLAKDEWGEDNSVTFSIEEKKGNIYYIAVKSNATVISWYEVNTETWIISEFY